MLTFLLILAYISFGDFKGNDVSRESIDEALNNMEYSFSYNDDYLRIIDTEILDTFVSDPS